MATFLRLLVGLSLLPMCWAFVRALFDSFIADRGSFCSVEGMSLLGGMVVFALAWAVLSHPIKMYVFGHELTHALWGLMFGARPSNVRVSESGGSVRLTKTNFLVTLAPYFFPFYTFVVILVAVVTYAFVRPLPFMPLWMFLIGFTWSFHVLFTVETLAQRQPDIKMYGRFFSWTVILIFNIALVLVWLAAMTQLTFADISKNLLKWIFQSYSGLFALCGDACRWIAGRFGNVS